MLANRYIDVGCVRNPEGVARVVLNLPAWEDYVALALDEVIIAGIRSLQVRARLVRLLVELHDLVPPDRQAGVQRRLDIVRAATVQGDAAPTGQG